MVLTALADTDQGKLDAQYQVLRLWEDEYKQALRIFLPDTYGTDQFLANVPQDIKLESWRGFRQDSGDPVAEGDKYLNWLGRQGASPKEKLVIFSDGLDVDEMIRLQKMFGGHTNVSDGWGTLLTNDFRGCAPGDALRPFSMVCKVVAANGRPVVKLSNNPEKATGPADEVAHYKRIFGTHGQVSQPVIV
jgi:nicotinate phosphoribosyltransferase